MAADDVTKTVKAVEELDHKSGDQGGGKAAYTELKKEYDSYSKTHTAEETKQYWDGVTNQLKKDNVLPDLAVAWGQEHLNRVDGKSASEIASQYEYGFTGADAKYNFDKAFATSLSENIKNVDTTGSFWTDTDDGKISQRDLNTYLSTQSETNRDVAEKSNNRNDMAPLFKGNPPLISVLDGADDNNEQDGNVSKSDMRRYLDDYNRFTSNGTVKAAEGSPYTAENAQYVKDILDGKHPGVSDGGGFDVSDLARKGGFDNKDIGNAGDYTSVVDKFNSLQPKEDTVAKSGVTTNGDTTVVKYPDGRERDFHFSGDQVDAVKDFNGNWKRNSDGSWVDASDANKKAPFKDVSVDRTTGVVTYDRGDQGKLSIGADGKDTAAAATTTTDANNASITKNDSGAVTDVKYADGSTRHFDYSNGELTSFTNPDGTKFVSADGGKTFQSPGRADVSNVKVDADGSFHCTVDGQAWKIGTDDKGTKEDAPVQPVAAGDQVEKQLVDAGTAKAGEGYIKVAARLLGKPTANDTDPAVRALYQELEKLNNNRTLHPGDTVVTPEILAKIQNEDFKKYVAGLKTPPPQEQQTPAENDDNEEA